MSSYTSYWISLPVGWKLEDVQAALNVVITALSALAIFAFVRFCWQRAARNVAENKDVSLHSLLSLNTIGEAFDVALLLNKKLLTSKYLGVLAQCLVVLCLSTTAILSGPIVRYSSQRGTITVQENVSGLLASRAHNSMGYANVEWNTTYSRLVTAGFPTDQLVDYLPDNSINWVYDDRQWNSTWSLDCQQTQQTFIQLDVKANCTRFLYQFPGLRQAFEYGKWDDYTYSWDGIYNSTKTFKDILVFVYATTESDYNEDQETSQSMSMMLTAIHMHGIPRATRNSTQTCWFGPGTVDQASYTKIECEMKRKHMENDNDWFDVAFPDVGEATQVPYAYTAYYQARFSQQATSDSPISVITPSELVRFYQTYTIVKDLQYRQPVTRRLNVQRRVVQLSAIFLAVILFVALLTIFCAAKYGLFAIRHSDVMATTPQSKLDWMMQSIQAEDRPLAEAPSSPGLRRSVTVDSVSHMRGMSRPKRRRREFETATYGGRETSTWFLSGSAASSQYEGRSPTLYQSPTKNEPFMYHGSPQLVNHDKTPMLTQTTTIN